MLTRILSRCVSNYFNNHESLTVEQQVSLNLAPNHKLSVIWCLHSSIPSLNRNSTYKLDPNRSEEMKTNYMSRWLQLPNNYSCCSSTSPSHHWYDPMECPLRLLTEEKKKWPGVQLICILNWHHLEMNGCWKTALCRVGYGKPCWKENFRTLSKTYDFHFVGKKRWPEV